MLSVMKNFDSEMPSLGPVSDLRLKMTKLQVQEEELPTRLRPLPEEGDHEDFLRASVDFILKEVVFNGTKRSEKLLEFHPPQELQRLLDLEVKSNGESNEKMMQLMRDVARYSVKTGHPLFLNQLYSGVDPYGLIGQWLTDALNPSVYTFEVAPVFTLMEEVVLQELRRYVGWEEGDGIFCPGGSISNGYGINCARFNAFPQIKEKGVHAMGRLVMFSSADAHYSISKLAAFEGIGSDNVIKIPTDSSGKMIFEELENSLNKAKAEGAKPFLVVATAGTTVLGAFDPLDKIAALCEKEKLWFHVDAAWGGGCLMSNRHRHLLQGVNRADSVTWNPHKLLSAPQQCSTFLTRHKGVLTACHAQQASYLFQKDKCYDSKFDTGDKHIQCGRRADVLKFWFMWKAKGSSGFEKHVDRAFQMATYFKQQIEHRKGFEMVLKEPEFTNICFWYIPPSLRGQQSEPDYNDKLNKVAATIKGRMMAEGSCMITYQQMKGLPNFFRLVVQNSGLTREDMNHVVHLIEKLGDDL